MLEFLLNPALAGVMITVMTGVLGVFIVWRRMAYFGDTLSHSALLGIALGYLLGFNPYLGVVVVGALLAILLIWMGLSKEFSSDTLLGVLSHSALSMGLVTLSFVEGVRVDLNSWLFGDILLVENIDLLLIAGAVLFIVTVVYFIWKPLLSITVNEDLARIEGVQVTKISLIYTLLLAITIALAMKLVGALLITSMLVIPAAAARPFSKSPIAMVGLAVGIGCVSVLLGLSLSMWLDTPAGPSMVAVAAIAFFFSFFIPRRT